MLSFINVWYIYLKLLYIYLYFISPPTVISNKFIFTFPFKMFRMPMLNVQKYKQHLPPHLDYQPIILFSQNIYIYGIIFGLNIFSCVLLLLLQTQIERHTIAMYLVSLSRLGQYMQYSKWMMLSRNVEQWNSFFFWAYIFIFIYRNYVSLLEVMTEYIKVFCLLFLLFKHIIHEIFISHFSQMMF